MNIRDFHDDELNQMATEVREILVNQFGESRVRRFFSQDIELGFQLVREIFLAVRRKLAQ